MQNLCILQITQTLTKIKQLSPNSSFPFWSSVSGASQPLLSSQIWPTIAFVDKVSLEHKYIHLLVNCLWLLSHCRCQGSGHLTNPKTVWPFTESACLLKAVTGSKYTNARGRGRHALHCSASSGGWNVLPTSVQLS